MPTFQKFMLLSLPLSLPKTIRSRRFWIGLNWHLLPTKKGGLPMDGKGITSNANNLRAPASGAMLAGVMESPGRAEKNKKYQYNSFRILSTSSISGRGIWQIYLPGRPKQTGSLSFHPVQDTNCRALHRLYRHRPSGRGWTYHEAVQCFHVAPDA